jgi:hypothetical protein
MATAPPATMAIEPTPIIARAWRRRGEAWAQPQPLVTRPSSRYVSFRLKRGLCVGIR